MKINDALILRINELQQQRDWKQYNVSDASTVPQTTLVSIKKGRSKSIEVKTIYRLCEGFDISLKDFFDSSYFNRDALELE